MIPLISFPLSPSPSFIQFLLLCFGLFSLFSGAPAAVGGRNPLKKESPQSKRELHELRCCRAPCFIPEKINLATLNLTFLPFCIRLVRSALQSTIFLPSFHSQRKEWKRKIGLLNEQADSSNIFSIQHSKEIGFIPTIQLIKLFPFHFNHLYCIKY